MTIFSFRCKIIFFIFIWSLLSVSLVLTSCVRANKETTSNELKIQDGDNRDYALTESLQKFNQKALFLAGEIQLKSKQFGHWGPNKGWYQVNRGQLEFRMCGIKDMGSGGHINGSRFYIRSELGNVLNNPRIVDNDCLVWVLLISDFNYVASSFNLVVHFQISSLSGGLGKIVRRVVINPWDLYRSSSQSTPIRDLTNLAQSEWGQGRWVFGQENILDALAGRYIEPGETPLRLQMQGLTLEPSEPDKRVHSDYNKRWNHLSKKKQKRFKDFEERFRKQPGLKMKVVFKGQPTIVLKDATGIPQPPTLLTTGRFKVFMTLMATGASHDEKKYILSQSEGGGWVNGTAPSDLFWKVDPNDGLVGSFPIVLKYNSTYGRIKLALKIIPLDLPDTVKPFKAVYDLGTYNSWVKRQSPLFDTELSLALNNVDYDEYLGSGHPVASNLATVREAELFWFQPILLRFVRIMPGETATDRTLQYSAITCVRHGIYGTSVGQGLQFDITTYDEHGKILQGQKKGDLRPTTMRRQTNESGCIAWFGFLSHRYYQKEVLIHKKANVRFVGTYKKVPGQPSQNWESFINKYKTTFEYYMNPWDEKFTFGWDARDMPEGYVQEIAKQERDAPVSQIFIPDFKYDTMGFRYAIDKYMNLKVKKTVLLKTYPFALKYNSIVLGRRGTEPLRDGVYLMRLALQKDYLDPAAHGVSIYDSGLGEYPTDEEVKNYQENANLSRPTAVYREEKDSEPQIIAMGKDSSGEFISPRQLGEGKKEFITIQSKLVRVIGGIIVTPIEFEMRDLRLMRIRNQLFLQLQTIDEHKLRLAFVMSQSFKDVDMDVIYEKYKKIFKNMELLDIIEDGKNIHIDSKLQKTADELHNEILTQKTLKDIDLEGDRVKVFENIYRILGLLKKGESFSDLSDADPQIIERKRYIDDRLKEMDAFRALGLKSTDEYSEAQIWYRNQARGLIDRVLSELGHKAKDLINQDWSQKIDKDYIDSVNDDPMLKFFYLGNSRDVNKSLERLLGDRVRSLEKKLGRPVSDEDGLGILRSGNFSENPLAPEFSLDILRNDGADRSGLPSRTFVGPLTILLNTNGSSLRPTDILEETYCVLSTCSETEYIQLGVSDFRPTPVRPSAHPGLGGVEVPPKPVVENPRVTGVDQNGLFTVDKIHFDGNSRNFSNERNKYYGSLMYYNNMSFENYVDVNGDERKGLLQISRDANDKYLRGMEISSQIINFVARMGFRYVLLNQSRATNERSILKSVDIKCARDQRTPFSEINSKCFKPDRSGRWNFPLGEFLDELNTREKSFYDKMYKDFPLVLPFLGPSNPFFSPPKYSEKLQDGKEITVDVLKSLLKWGWAQTSSTQYRSAWISQCWNRSERRFNSSCRSYIEKYKSPGTPLPSLGMSLRSLETELKKPSEERIWPLEKDQRKILSFSMCRSLSQNFFSDSYWEKENEIVIASAKRAQYLKDRLIQELKNMCRRFTFNLFSGKLDVAKGYNLKEHPPVVFERKIRIYDTSGRHVYQGGKSLNISVSSKFDLTHQSSFDKGVNARFSPWRIMEGFLSSLPKVKDIVGGFDISFSTSRSDRVSEQNGTSVSPGTYLVVQQATLVIELKKYEYCIVVRFSPKMIHRFIRKSKYLNSDFDSAKDIDNRGFMICEGLIRDDPLPIREKYYYFTQHFTEGDMLDTANLHNHPWFLQLRGKRDFQTFVSLIGARKMEYLDKSFFHSAYREVKSDLQAMNKIEPNENLTMSVVSREKDMDWPIEELGRTYFNVLPTFPGLYTLEEQLGPDWPYEDRDPDFVFKEGGN